MSRPSGTSDKPRRTILSGVLLVITSPLNVTVPFTGRSTPVMDLSVVDLPAPFTPRSATSSPSATSSEMPWSALTAP